MLPTKHVTPALLSCWCQVACGTGSLLVLLPFWLSDFSWNTDMSLQTHMCLMLKQRILVLKTSRRLRKKATSDKHILYTILWTVIRRGYLLQVINMFWGITLNGEDRIIYIYMHIYIYIYVECKHRSIWDPQGTWNIGNAGLDGKKNMGIFKPQDWWCVMDNVLKIYDLVVPF